MQATPTLTPGERYAGVVLDALGAIRHHLILLPNRPPKRAAWQAQMDWAASVGGDLPSPQEQSILFANCRDALPEAWCWSNKTHDEDASYAWYCDFLDGNQFYYHKSLAGSAVAVRRLPLKSFNPFEDAAHTTQAAMSATPAAEGTFTHAPRPAIVPTEAKHAWQRRFGPGATVGDYKINPADREARAMRCELKVFRDGNCDIAEVRISLGLYTTAQITARLSPTELRELAARLIDAAHDIEALPADALARAQEGGAA